MHKLLLVSAMLLSAAPCLADTAALTYIVNCNAGVSLANAVHAALPNTTLLIEGSCAGPVTIVQSGLTLRASGTASVTGPAGSTVITVNGAARTTLIGLQISGGLNGIVGEGAAQLSLQNVTVTGNSQYGILLQSDSSATATGGSSSNNGLNGVDLEATSSLIVTGSYSISGNAVFGLNVNNTSSLTLVQGTLSVSSNTLGVQIGTTSSAFIADSQSTLNVTNNQTTGLTIVSGSHMVDFGGAINSTGNTDGISVDSKAGLDLDAAALVQSYNNSGDGVHIEETSVLTMFNTPAFSGAPGITTLKVTSNGMNGINLLTNSSITVINQAAISSTSNHLAGISADNGSSVTLVGSSIINNSTHDITLTFGARISASTSNIGGVSCDTTVLARGVTCNGG